MTLFVAALSSFLLLLLAVYAVAVLERLIRFGPRRAGLALAMPLGEAAAMLRREELAPRGADVLLFRSAPLLALVCVGLGALVIPLGPDLVGFDPSIGLFYFIVVLGPFVVAMMNAGWGQNSKQGLFGAF